MHHQPFYHPHHMKISKKTLSVLKNFAQVVNNTIKFEPGNKICAVHELDIVAASYACEEQFTQSCTIFDVQQLINVLSTLKEPELDFQPTQLLIQEGRRKIKYRYADEVIHNKTKFVSEFKVPEPVVSFKFGDDEFAFIRKNSDLLVLPHFCVEGREGQLSMSLTDYHNPGCNAVELDCEQETDKTFKFYFDMANLRFIPGSYNVSIIFIGSGKNTKAAGIFKSEDLTTDYFVQLDRKSLEAGVK